MYEINDRPTVYSLDQKINKQNKNFCHFNYANSVRFK